MRRSAAVLATLAVLTAACTPASDDDAQARADALVDELPSGWSTTVVADERVGEFVVSAPPEATTWSIGDDVEPLEAATAGSAWAEFWVPALRSTGTDRSNVRVVVADARSVPDSVVSWQVNVNAADPGLDLDDVADLADALRPRFEQQGLEVAGTDTVGWHDRTIAKVSFRVPEEIFAGEARYIRQWFIPEDDPDAMWSFTCDAPDDPDGTAELCRTALDGFVTAPDGPVDPADAAEDSTAR